MFPRLFYRLTALILLSNLASTALYAGDASQKVKQPNIILMLTDDQGWGDLGFNGNKNIETPTLDKLFTDGVTFDRFYVSPVCAPTRASLLTGRHSLATGVYSVTRGGEKMHKDEITLAEILKKAGYSTGLFGKWHNGLQYPYDPNGQGFDEFYGFADGHITRYFDNTMSHNGDTVSYKGYLTDRLTDRAVEFITQNKDKPFFSYISFNTPHSPFELPKKYFNKYKRKGLSDLDASVYGMVENIDDNVNKVLTTLDKLKLTKNTIVIYLSDNGPAFPGGNARYNGGMKGNKGHVDEGGVRVPFVIHWPSHLKSGINIKQPAQHIDLLPTLVSLAGIEPVSHEIHGRDLSTLLANGGNVKDWEDTQLYIHHFRNTQRPHQQAIQKNPGAIRTERWLATLDHSDRWRLYDLLNDPKQKKELGSANPDIVKSLSQSYYKWYDNLIQEHGPYTALPIEVGHSVRQSVHFPAHESEISGEGLDYAHKSGWAHDWVVTQKTAPGTISWPLKVVKPGTYKLKIGYATPDGDYKGNIKVSLLGANYEVNELPKFIPKKDHGERLYYTGEAPELTWAETEIKNIKLAKDTGQLALNFARDKHGKKLMVKYVKIEKED